MMNDRGDSAGVATFQWIIVQFPPVTRRQYHRRKKKQKEKTSRSAISGSRLKIIITLQPRPFRYFSFDLTSDHNREKHVADVESSQRFPTRFDVVERRYRNMGIQSCVYTSLHNNYTIIRIARYYLIIRIRSSYKQRRFSLTYVFYINIRIMFRWCTVVIICFQKHIFYEHIGVRVFYELIARIIRNLAKFYFIARKFEINVEVNIKVGRYLQQVLIIDQKLISSANSGLKYIYN